MASVATQQPFSVTPSSAARGGTWRRSLITWLTARSDLRRQWDRLGITASGRRVPYRVWSRHGAYLQMQRQQRSH